MKDEKEKEFLHKVTSPLAGVLMMLESMADDLKDQPDPHGHLERLEATIGGMARMRELIELRRKEVLDDK